MNIAPARRSIQTLPFRYRRLKRSREKTYAMVVYQKIDIKDISATLSSPSQKDAFAGIVAAIKPRQYPIDLSDS